MKSLLFILFISFSTYSLADAWDNLSYSEAEQVVAYLKENPFVFQYCDCCSSDGEYATRVHLVKVNSTTIEKCDWDQNFYSVHYTFESIVEIRNTENGPDLSILSTDAPEVLSDKIYMNYTWGYSKNSRLAEPLFNSIHYTYYGESPSPCKIPIAYPSPRMLKNFSVDKSYAKWYKKHIL